MQDFHQITPAPCIVNEGILINRTDIMRALETLETVKYSFKVDGSEMSQGNGIVAKIFASPNTSTLIVNGCIFINVLSFNYLRFSIDKNQATIMELVEDSKTLRLTAIHDQEHRNGMANRNVFSDRCYDEETYAELFDDPEDDERY